MADLLLGATNIATESSGTVTLQNATLGSTVAIPAAGITGTLGSGVTFPAGHIIQVQSSTGDTEYTSETELWDKKITDLNTLITPSSASNKILLFGTVAAESPASQRIMVDFYKNASDFTETYNLSGKTAGMGQNYATHVLQTVMTIPFLDTAGTEEEITYSISFRGLYDGYTVYCGTTDAAITSLIALEIKV